MNGSSSDRPGRDHIFGLRISDSDVAGTAALITALPAEGKPGARLFVTPNIQHVADMRHNAELRAALEGAALLVCDGFPVAAYARMRGCANPGRVTGREVVEQIMLHSDLSPRHRLFFLVDSEETADALRRWAERQVAGFSCIVEVAPMRFGADAAYCEALAGRLRAQGTTLLFLCVGAPRSEIFAWRYREALPDCWALCVGQSARLVLGLVRRPPALIERLNLEWLWRVILEPRRLISRYARSSIGFLLAIGADLMAARGGRKG